MPGPDRTRQEGASGRQGVQTENSSETRKSGQSEQGVALCSECGRAGPPDTRWHALWRDGRCWYCLHGIVLKREGEEREQNDERV